MNLPGAGANIEDLIRKGGLVVEQSKEIIREEHRYTEFRYKAERTKYHGLDVMMFHFDVPISEKPEIGAIMVKRITMIFEFQHVVLYMKGIQNLIDNSLPQPETNEG